jgi:hypothetical protein
MVYFSLNQNQQKLQVIEGILHFSIEIFNQKIKSKRPKKLIATAQVEQHDCDKRNKS